MRILNIFWFFVGVGLLIYAGVTYTKVTRELQDVVADMVDSQAVAPAINDTEAEPAPTVALPRLFGSRGRELTDKQVLAMLSRVPTKGGARLTLREDFNLQDLMGEDEKMPEGDLRNLMANVRSIDLARARCPDIVRVFDGGCVYDNHKAKPTRFSQFGYEIDADYIVAFSDGIGTIPEGDAFAIVSEPVNARFPYNPGRPDDILKPDYETALHRALAYLAQACETIRSSTGNCYVKSASIRQYHKLNRKPLTHLEVKGSLEFLMPIELAELR